VIAYRDGAAVRLSDVAEVEDSVENLRNIGLANGKPAVVVILRRQQGANIIDTVERVKAVLPQLEASIPRAIDIELMLDRTTTIRSSLHEVERTLVIAVCLVVLVVFACSSIKKSYNPSMAFASTPRLRIVRTAATMRTHRYRRSTLTLCDR
jgi:multidrug efflux pump